MRKLYCIGLLSVFLSSVLVAMEKIQQRPTDTEGLASLCDAAEIEEGRKTSSLIKRSRSELQEDPVVLKKRHVVSYSVLMRVLLDSVDKDIDSKTLIQKVGAIMGLSDKKNHEAQQVVWYVVLQEIMRECVDISLWEKLVNQIFGASLLHVAALNGHLGAIEFLLQKGAQMEAKRTSDGATSLHLAALNGHVGAVGLLIQRGAQLEAKRTCDGATPLHLAVLRDRLGAMALLLSKGAQIEAKSTSGATALSIAEDLDRLNIIAYLRGVMLARKILSDVNELHLPAESMRVAIGYLQKSLRDYSLRQ